MHFQKITRNIYIALDGEALIVATPRGNNVYKNTDGEYWQKVIEDKPLGSLLLGPDEDGHYQATAVLLKKV
jgi:hypothetical protein